MTFLATFRPPAQARPGQRALWLDQAGAPSLSDVEQVALPSRADVCIVGGGYTGLWTAIHLKQSDPSLDVVILEADICGGQASGRNGGFVMTAWSKFATLKKVCGTEDARRYARSVEQAVTAIGTFCGEHGVDGNFHQGGWLWTATNRSQIDAWKYTVDELAAVGESPYQVLDRDEVARRSGSPSHVGGLFEAAPATIHPGRLVRGLTDVARRLGVTIVENCSMTELQGGGSPVVRTTRGPVTADRVILAISAWSTAIAEIRRSLLVIASDVIATEPVPERLDAIGWKVGVSVSDSRRLVNYYRTTEDGRVIFGKGGGGLAFSSRITDSFNRSAAAASDVRAQFHRIYPMLSDVSIACHWRGAVDYSATGLPCVGPLAKEPNLLIAAGFSGNGVGPSYVAGSALADMVLGREPEQMPEALRALRGGRMPPEPLRYLAGRVVREAVRRKEDVEDLGRTPGRLLTGVASLDPTSFTDRGGSASPAAAPSDAVASNGMGD